MTDRYNLERHSLRTRNNEDESHHHDERATQLPDSIRSILVIHALGLSVVFGANQRGHFHQFSS